MHYLLKSFLICNLLNIAIEANAFKAATKTPQPAPVSENKSEAIKAGQEIKTIFNQSCQEKLDSRDQLHEAKIELSHSQCETLLALKDLSYADITCSQATHNGTLALLESQCALRVQSKDHDINMLEYKLSQTLEQLQHTLNAKALPSSSETLNTPLSTPDTSSYFTLTNLAYIGIPTFTAIALYCYHNWDRPAEQPGVNRAPVFGAVNLFNMLGKFFVTTDNNFRNNPQQDYQNYQAPDNIPLVNPDQGSMGHSVVSPHLKQSPHQQPSRFLCLEESPSTSPLSVSSSQSSLIIENEEDADVKEEEDNNDTEAEYKRQALVLERERLKQKERLELKRMAENQRQSSINQELKEEKLKKLTDIKKLKKEKIEILKQQLLQKAAIAAKQQEQEQQRRQQQDEALEIEKQRLAQDADFKRTQLEQEALRIALEERRLIQEADIAAQQIELEQQRLALQASIAAQQPASPVPQQSSSSSSSQYIVDGIKEAEQDDFKQNDEATEDDLEIQVPQITVSANPPTPPAPMAIILHPHIVHNPVQFRPFIRDIDNVDLANQFRSLFNFRQTPAPQQPLPTQPATSPTNSYTHILARLINGQNAFPSFFFPQMNQGFVLNNQALVPVNAIVPFQAPRQPSLIDTLIGNWPRLAVMQNGRLLFGRSLFLAAIPVVAQFKNPFTQFLNKYRQADSKKPTQSQ